MDLLRCILPAEAAIERPAPYFSRKEPTATPK